MVCKSCERDFEGNFCDHCGERAILETDRSFRNLIGDLISALTFADTKLWRSVKLLIKYPGRFSKYYIQGRRVQYMKPISLFFLANFLYFIFPVTNTFNTNLDTQISSGTFVHQPIAKRMVEERLKKKELSLQDYSKSYDSKTNQLSRLLLILIVCMLSLFSYLTHFNKQSYLLDHFVLSLELMTYMLIVPILGIMGPVWLLRMIVPFQFPYEEAVLTTLFMLLIAYSLYRAYREFFNAKTTKALIQSVLGLVSFIIVLFSYRAMLFFITFWLT